MTFDEVAEAARAMRTPDLVREQQAEIRRLKSLLYRYRGEPGSPLRAEYNRKRREARAARATDPEPDNRTT